MSDWQLEYFVERPHALHFDIRKLLERHTFLEFLKQTVWSNRSVSLDKYIQNDRWYSLDTEVIYTSKYGHLYLYVT